MKSSRILITGGAGYIGSHLSEFFLKKGSKVVIVDNLSSGNLKLVSKKSKFFKINILNDRKIKSVINKEKINTIIHLAAKISLQEAQTNPKKYFKNNVEGTNKLLKAIKGTKVKNIIFSSTAAVYSGNKKICCKENLNPKPTNLYGKTKLIAEKKISNFCKENNLFFSLQLIWSFHIN